jgi:hypothetical protein
MGLNITVLCTYGYQIPLHFYKYYSALPLIIIPEGAEHQLFVNE